MARARSSPQSTLVPLLPMDWHGQREMCRPCTDDYEKKKRAVCLHTYRDQLPKPVQIPDIGWYNGHDPSAASSATAPAPAEVVHWSHFIRCHKRLWQNPVFPQKQGSLETHQIKNHKSVPNLGKINIHCIFHMKATGRSPQQRLHQGMILAPSKPHRSCYPGETLWSPQRELFTWQLKNTTQTARSPCVSNTAFWLETADKPR